MKGTVRPKEKGFSRLPWKKGNMELDSESEQDISSTDDERELRRGQPRIADETIAQKIPQMPSKEEVDKHNLTHIPFRSWCPHCVRGKSVSKYHKKTKVGRDNELPVISMDYAYLKGKSIDSEKDRGQPILVIKDRKSRYLAAEVVSKKGSDDYACKWALNTIKGMGYRGVVMKDDQESSIKDLKEQVAKAGGADVEFAPEESPVGESKSNGEVERAIRTIKAQIRAMKDGLET